MTLSIAAPAGAAKSWLRLESCRLIQSTRCRCLTDRPGRSARNTPAAEPSGLWLVVAVGAPAPVIGVADIVLSDHGLAVVGHEDQILFKDGGAELPARGQLQARTQILQIFELLVWVLDQAGRLHYPRVALGIIQDVGARSLPDAHAGVTLGVHDRVGEILAFADLFGDGEPHDPVC